MRLRSSASHFLAVFLSLALVSLASASDNPAAPLDVETLAKCIDHNLAVRMTEQGVPPAALTDDAAFLRRVYLDLAGCIPSIIDARDFLDDPRPNKRRLWVDMILDGKKPSRKPDAFNQHFANVYRAWLLSRVNSEQGAGLASAAETWLRERFKNNMPYDRLVREMITASPSGNDSASASVFFQINENKPENLAASTSRLFLGIKLECAQCHDDRSGGNWSQEQFWSFAAFFAGKDIAIPGRKKAIRARFLDDSEPKKSSDNPRVVLADWLVSDRNPYFARAAVNRLWAHFWGTGLTDPIDEQGSHNPPSHPELLDELAQQFIAHNFDLKYLIRTFVATQAYQRSSVVDHPGQDDPRLFAHDHPRPQRRTAVRQPRRGDRVSRQQPGYIESLRQPRESLAATEILGALRPSGQSDQSAHVDSASSVSDEQFVRRRADEFGTEQNAGHHRRRREDGYAAPRRDAVPGGSIAQADGDGIEAICFVCRWRRSIGRSSQGTGGCVLGAAQ